MKISRRVSAWHVRPQLPLVFLAVSPFAALAQQKQLPAEAASDPILRALQAELTRSKAQLKMDNVDSPFYIEYRVFDVEQFDASAAFGALRDQNRTRLRLLRAVVRLGDYKLDSFFNAGQGISDILPLDNDELAIRHQVWLATDQAYKRASEAFSNKKAHAQAAERRPARGRFRQGRAGRVHRADGEAGCGSGQVDENAGVRDFRVQERSADSILHGQPELHRALPVFREHGRHGHAARIRALPDSLERQRTGARRHETGALAAIHGEPHRGAADARRISEGRAQAGRRT